jgi:hypothetical protein
MKYLQLLSRQQRVVLLKLNPLLYFHRLRLAVILSFELVASAIPLPLSPAPIKSLGAVVAGLTFPPHKPTVRRDAFGRAPHGELGTPNTPKRSTSSRKGRVTFLQQMNKAPSVAHPHAQTWLLRLPPIRQQ